MSQVNGHNPTAPGDLLVPFAAPLALFSDYYSAAQGRLSQHLRPVATVLGLAYLGQAGVLTWADDVDSVLFQSAALTGVFFFALRLFLARVAVPARWTHPLASFSAGLVIAHALLQIIMAREPWATAHLILTLLGMSCLFLSRPWFTVMGAVAVGSWFYVAWPHRGNPEWFHLGVFLVLSTGLAAFFHEKRLAILLDWERRILNEEAQRERYERATTAARREHDRYSILYQGSVDATLRHEAGKIVDANPAATNLFGYTHAELTTMSVLHLLDPAVHQSCQEAIRLGTYEATTSVGRKRNGETFAIELISKSAGSQQMSSRLLILRDISQKTDLEKSLFEKSRRTESVLRRQSVLADLWAMSVHQETITKILQMVVDFAQSELPATAGSYLLMWDGHKNEFVVAARHAEAAIELEGLATAEDEQGIVTWLNEQREGLVVPELGEDTFHLRRLFPTDTPGAFAAMPLTSEDGVFGILLALDSNPREYRREDVEFLQLLARRAAEACTALNVADQLRRAAGRGTRPSPPSPPPVRIF